MPVKISRRDFLKIIFFTAPALAVGSHLSTLWPAERKSLPIAQSYVFGLDDSNFIFDTEFKFDDALPTVRGCYGFDTINWRRKLSLFREKLSNEKIIQYSKKPINRWKRQEVDHFFQLHAALLDEIVDVDKLTFEECAQYSEFWAGVEVYYNLPDLWTELKLTLVEGQYPGHAFCAVRCDGDPDDLNEALAKRGLNMIIDTDIPWETLLP